ncbi:hypothetical protein BjapCC829_48520 (plasmid) [Bradyrhizobium barranii]|uniref:Uncharacterized protein n=1 Tax=Bradyrhizobium barranii TaxID=2992140 RepID=A0ABY3R1E7_9BRAD|nr:hypothetical protein [Bradyrhizobium japonicum]UFW92103.1 hypothetical protein BjapCC829_48520 [Bradyrhizobium japonicum]
MRQCEGTKELDLCSNSRGFDHGTATAAAIVAATSCCLMPSAIAQVAAWVRLLCSMIAIARILHYLHAPAAYLLSLVLDVTGEIAADAGWAPSDAPQGKTFG